MEEQISLEAVPEPKAEGDKRMARGKGRIVIAGAPLMHIAALRRQGDQPAAEEPGAETEGAIAEIGIVFRIAPRCSDAAADLGGQFGEGPGGAGGRNGGRPRTESPFRHAHSE